MVLGQIPTPSLRKRILPDYDAWTCLAAPAECTHPPGESAGFCAGSVPAPRSVPRLRAIPHLRAMFDGHLACRIYVSVLLAPVARCPERTWATAATGRHHPLPPASNYPCAYCHSAEPLDRWQLVAPEVWRSGPFLPPAPALLGRPLRPPSSLRSRDPPCRARGRQREGITLTGEAGHDHAGPRCIVEGAPHPGCLGGGAGRQDETLSTGCFSGRQQKGHREAQRGHG